MPQNEHKLKDFKVKSISGLIIVNFLIQIFAFVSLNNYNELSMDKF